MQISTDNSGQLLIEFSNGLGALLTLGSGASAETAARVIDSYIDTSVRTALSTLKRWESFSVTPRLAFLGMSLPIRDPELLERTRLGCVTDVSALTASCALEFIGRLPPWG